MKRRNIIHWIVAAAVICGLAFPLKLIASVIINDMLIDHLLTNGIATTSVFVFIFLMLSSRKNGRWPLVLTAAGSSVLLVSTLVCPMIFHLLLCTFVIWLARISLWYESYISVILDAGICIASFSVALVALLLTGGFLFSLWCFLLIQSVSVFVPKSFSTSSSGRKSGHDSRDRFTVALQDSERAFSQLVQATK